MKLHELLQKIDDNDVSIQPIEGSVYSAKKMKDHTKLTIATNMVTVNEVLTGDFGGVLILVRIDKDAYKAALNS